MGQSKRANAEPRGKQGWAIMSTWIRPLVCVVIRKKPLLLPRYEQVLTDERCGVVHLLADALCARKHPRSILNKSTDAQTYPTVCQRITKGKKEIEFA